jgi:ribonuclease D
MISTQEGLKKLTDKLEKEEVFALDTEFHGERRYWPDLFLIQIADQDGPVAIDPLEIEDLSPLGRLFESTTPVKVIHSSRNDIDVLMHHLNIEFSSVFDTQLAAAFLGHPRQTALFKLVKAECNIYPKKGHTLSDWSLRPLANDQIEYALDDVRYLLEIYRNQVKRLNEMGRYSWYCEEAKTLTDPATYNSSINKLFRKVKSKSKIRSNRLHILWALIKWREYAAKQVNKPRNFVVKDYVLGAITTMAPENKRSLARLRGISSGFISKWGDEIIKAISDADKIPDSEIPSIPRHHSQPGVSARKDILRIFLKQESCRLNISPELLLSKDLINALAKNPPDTEEELYSLKELSGWRKEALGDGLISLLKGKLALKLNSRGNSGLDFIRTE